MRVTSWGLGILTELGNIHRYTLSRFFPSHVGRTQLENIQHLLKGKGVEDNLKRGNCTDPDCVQGDAQGRAWLKFPRRQNWRWGLLCVAWWSPGKCHCVCHVRLRCLCRIRCTLQPRSIDMEDNGTWAMHMAWVLKSLSSLSLSGSLAHPNQHSKSYYWASLQHLLVKKLEHQFILSLESL